MVVPIPGLANYLDLMRGVAFFDRFIHYAFILGAALVVVVTFRPIFPYGKTYTRGTALLKLEMPDRLAFMLVTLPPLLIFLYAHLYFPNGNLLSPASLCYVAHYVHRSLIYPWFRSSFSKRWPLESVLYHAITNTLCATIAFHQTIFGLGNMHWTLQAVLTLCFVSSAVGAALHDYRVCGLRRSGENGYQIPRGLLFKWVSGPQYLCELIQWLLFMPFLGYGFPMATFAVYHLVNITGRAEAVHEAYVRKLFKNKYPEERTPYIPLLRGSKYII
jgi:hypothetical protein